MLQENSLEYFILHSSTKNTKKNISQYLEMDSLDEPQTKFSL